MIYLIKAMVEAECSVLACIRSINLLAARTVVIHMAAASDSEALSHSGQCAHDSIFALDVVLGTRSRCKRSR